MDSPLRFPGFSPFSGDWLFDVVVDYRYAFVASAAIVALLWWGRFAGRRTSRLPLRSQEGLQVTPVLVWGVVAASDLRGAFGMIHPNEVLLWIPIVDSALALLLLLVFQTVALWLLFPGTLDVCIGARFRLAAWACILSVVLDGFFVIFAFRRLW